MILHCSSILVFEMGKYYYYCTQHLTPGHKDAVLPEDVQSSFGVLLEIPLVVNISASWSTALAGTIDHLGYFLQKLWFNLYILLIISFYSVIRTYYMLWLTQCMTKNTCLQRIKCISLQVNSFLMQWPFRDWHYTIELVHSLILTTTHLGLHQHSFTC